MELPVLREECPGEERQRDASDGVEQAREQDDACAQLRAVQLSDVGDQDRERAVEAGRTKFISMPMQQIGTRQVLMSTCSSTSIYLSISSYIIRPLLN